MKVNLLALIFLAASISSGAHAALMSASSSSNASLTLTGFSGGSDFVALGFTSEVPSGGSIVGAPATLNVDSLGTLPCCGVNLGVGDSFGGSFGIEIEADSTTIGFGGGAIGYNFALALLNLTDSVQMLTVDVLVDQVIQADSGTTGWETGAYAQYGLTTAVRDQNGNDSDAVELSEDRLLSEFRDEVGSLGQSLLFLDTLVLEVQPGEIRAVGLETFNSARAVPQIPLPASIWLFGIGLLLLVKRPQVFRLSN